MLNEIGWRLPPVVMQALLDSLRVIRKSKKLFPEDMEMSPEQIKENKRRLYIHASHFGEMILEIMGVEPIYEGLEKLAEATETGEGLILVSNHNSIYEIMMGLAMPSVVPGVRCYFGAKKELFDIRYFGPAMRNLGMVEIDREKETLTAMREVIRGAKRVKKEGSVLVLYPEGTRIRDDPQHTLKKYQELGAFYAAVSADVTVAVTATYGGLDVNTGTFLNTLMGRFHHKEMNPVYMKFMGFLYPADFLSKNPDKDEKREAAVRMMNTAREMTLEGIENIVHSHYNYEYWPKRMKMDD